MLDGHSSLQPKDAENCLNDVARQRKGQAVRLGNAGDIEAVMGLLRLMHAEVGEEAMDEGKVRVRVEQCLTEGFLCVATSDEKVVGTCGLIFTTFWYSSGPVHLADSWFFVDPERRQSSYAGKLRRFCEDLAVKMDMKLYWTVVFTKETERKVAFFARHSRLYAHVYIGGKDV